MFIEKISNNNKFAYLKTLVDRTNSEQGHGYNDQLLRTVVYDPQNFIQLKPFGMVNRVKDLNKRNIYLGIYENYFRAGLDTYYDQNALIVAFGDTDMQKFKLKLAPKQLHKPGAESPLLGDKYLCLKLELIFHFIEQNQARLNHKKVSESNARYMHEFILPNLQSIDRVHGTQLYADCTLMMADQIKKKSRLVISDLQKQIDSGLIK